MSRKGETRMIAGIHFLSLDDVAAQLGVSVRSVMEEIDSGRLTAKKLGGSWHVTPLWLDEFVSTPDIGPPEREEGNAALRRVIRVRASRPPREKASRKPSLSSSTATNPSAQTTEAPAPSAPSRKEDER